MLQTAVITGEQVTLGYQSPRSEPSLRVVHPLGIAAKGPQWYLVADTDFGLRTFRVDRVSSVDGTGVAVVRPEGFELAAAWKLIAERFDERWLVSVRALAEPSVVSALRWVFGTKLRLGPQLRMAESPLNWRPTASARWSDRSPDSGLSSK